MYAYEYSSGSVLWQIAMRGMMWAQMSYRMRLSVAHIGNSKLGYAIEIG